MKYIYIYFYIMLWYDKFGQLDAITFVSLLWENFCFRMFLRYIVFDLGYYISNIL